jgi:cytochrome d ubiquinol oxidase subunit I
MDVVLLSRIQFALTVAFHFIFVPLSIGLGLIVAVTETKYYRSRKPEDRAASRFWVKVFTATFVIGVATGITMEFSFGTNWANYSRFVGDIFGAPLAAEALIAFFLESVFLGIVLFARDKIKPLLYTISTWLVWVGSALSALWILIANSWMQTPAGYDIVGTGDSLKAQITNFFAAAFNPSTVPRYLHTVDALLIMGAFVCMAVGAYYLLKKRSKEQEHWGMQFLKTGMTVGLVTLILMLPFAHMQASEVASEQPSKLAAMEGQWNDGAVNMSIVGWVDEANQTTYSLDLPIPGFTSWLASWNNTTVYPGLKTLSSVDPSNDQAGASNVATVDLSKYTGVAPDSYKGGIPPVNFTFQAYHLMILLYAVMIIWLILAFIMYRGYKKGNNHKVLQYLVCFGPIIPFLAIQAGWIVTEVGRQPWIVFNQMLTTQGVSNVSAVEVLITIVLFIVFYLVLLIAWLKIVLRMIKKGPDAVDNTPAPKDGKGADKTAATTAAAATEGGE